MANGIFSKLGYGMDAELVHDLPAIRFNSPHTEEKGGCNLS